jgi:dTDP-glucose 4,6-dehydratase
LPELFGARFTLLSRDPERFRSDHGELLTGIDVKLVHGDILRPETLPKGDYTHILHAATDSTFGPQLTPLQRYDQIVNGTRNILELARHCDKPRVLLTSSGGVYGNIAQFPLGVSEEYFGIPDPMEAQNAYSIAKRQAEHLCILYYDSYGVESVVARCFAFVGQDLPVNAHFAIGNFIRDALANADIVIEGDGTPVRSYMDQRDLARWLITLMLSGRSCRAYNVGSTEAVSISELAKRVSLMSPGRRPNVHVLNRVLTGQASTRNFYIPDISRAQNELGLSLEFCLNDSIRHVISCARI